MSEDDYYCSKQTTFGSWCRHLVTAVRVKTLTPLPSLSNKNTGFAKYAITMFLVSAILLMQIQVNAQREALNNKQSWTEYALAFTIPVGEHGIHYESRSGVESETWGPSGLRIAPDGSFLVVDTVSNTILRYNAEGAMVESIKVPDATAITDVAIDAYGLYVLDEGGAQSSVYRIDSNGTILTKTHLPSELRAHGLSGITFNDRGELVAEMQGGLSTANVDGTIQSGKVLFGDRYSVELPNLQDQSADRFHGVVIKGRNRIAIDTRDLMGALSIIGTRSTGDFFVLVEELSNTSTLQVDQTIRHYSAAGKLLGVARVPILDRYTYVRNGVAVAPDGQVYALVTWPERADVVRLRFYSTLASVLPASKVAPESTLNMLAAPEPSLATTCRTRDDMINTAWAYINNRTWLTITNLNGTCSGRVKPHYLGNTAGYYNSVPYNWGGFVTVSQYNSDMVGNKLAGHLPTYDEVVRGCASGVDCSGYVSRIWGTTTKYSTSTLPGISTSVSSATQLQRGDIILRSDSAVRHVVLFESVSSNGVNTLEATTYNNYDRAVYIWNGWSRFNGYTFYKYANVCETSQAKPVVSSSLRLSSSGPYYVGQTVNGYFTITNRGTGSITFSRLLIGGRLNGDQSCSGGCPDFSSASNVTLSPGQSYSYSGSRYLDRAGSYGFFVGYQKSDGSWVTNVPTENGAINSLTINVQNAAPTLAGKSPTYIYASPYDQTVYFSGTRLTNTQYMFVQFPSGSGAYIYPPGQIFSRSSNQLGCKIKFGSRGQYYVRAYTSDGGWSNTFGVYVY